MLVAGGLLDQPVEWFVANRAVGILEFLKAISKPDFKQADANWTAADYELDKQIRETKQRMKRGKYA